MAEFRDGTQVLDRRLDRLKQFDPRSRGYVIDEAVSSRRPRSYTWRMRSYVLDQGPDGACVGFGVTHELMARPSEVRFPSLVEATTFALAKIYWEAQKRDPWAGGAYPGANPRYEGTSVLAGLQIAQALGYFEEYNWAFDLEGAVLGVGHGGPAVIGVDWLASMNYPASDGFITPTGSYQGGHCLLVVGVKIIWKNHLKLWWRRTFEDVDLDRSYFTLLNSWGPSWGDNGRAKMTLRNFGYLQSRQGEVAFAGKRRTHPRP